MSRYFHEGNHDPDMRTCIKCWKYFCPECGKGTNRLYGTCSCIDMSDKSDKSCDSSTIKIDWGKIDWGIPKDDSGKKDPGIAHLEHLLMDSTLRTNLDLAEKAKAPTKKDT